ncbi:MAG: PorV/PorQ family protein [bacterium]|nr:PorV/PorQ family protein [bacterium]
MTHGNITTVSCLTIILLLLSLNPAIALDDGGGRSVFARGAGERALALGGAYSAVANDPGAMIWNPAGLAQLNRRNIYASHTNLIGMGFTEQAGMMALPHWKWGTLGFGYRRFAVDGIEGRDDRGTIYDDNLQNAETEILMGYGRKIGTAWDLGMTLKYQRQELAGYSDGAPGLDLGMRVSPLQAFGGQSSFAEDLKLGFSVRNLIEPNMRLKEDGVKDPTGLRVGLAYNGEFSKNLHLLLTGDIEKTREMDTRLHAGAEVRLLDILALRVGSNSGMMTAGAGFQVASLTCDYAFEDNPLETVHRFGVGLAFGATTQETRQAKLQAQELEMREQLAAAFMKESDERVQSILNQAHVDLQDGAFSSALGGIETIKVLDPNCKGLKELESEAYYQQGLQLDKANDLAGAQLAFQRSVDSNPQHSQANVRLMDVAERSSRNAARSKGLRAQYDKALEAYARGDLIQAQEGFTSILKLNPKDREAKALLTSTRQTLNLRAGALIDQAHAKAMAQDFAGARNTLKEAASLVPEHSGLAEALVFIDSRQEQIRQSKLAVETKPKVQPEASDPISTPVEVKSVATVLPTFNSLSATERQEVADLYQRGLKAVEENRHQDAIRYWELVWSRAQDYQQVADNLKQEYLAMGMEDFAAGRLEESIRVWEKAQRVDPDDNRTQGYLARAYEHKTRIREIKGDH